MAAGTIQEYNAFKLRLLNSTDDWAADNHYAVLLTSSASFVATHTQFSDISANEISDSDYTSLTTEPNLTNESVTESTGTVKLDADAVTFGTNVTITARYIAYLKGTFAARSGTDLLCAFAAIDDTADQSSTNGTFEVDFNASNGMLTAT